MIISLDKLLLYTNTKVIQRYKEDYPKNKFSSEDAFTELLKFLWLSRKLELEKDVNISNSNLNFSCLMHNEMSDIDDMWHSFLLFTKDYMNFCGQYFGTYMHHTPFTEEDEIPTEEKFRSELNAYLYYIHENLGEKTLLKWFGQDSVK